MSGPTVSAALEASVHGVVVQARKYSFSASLSLELGRDAYWP